MSDLPSVKARVLRRALIRLGFVEIPGKGSHRILKHPDGRTLLFSFHDREEVGPRMLAKVLKDAGLDRKDVHTWL